MNSWNWNASFMNVVNGVEFDGSEHETRIRRVRYVLESVKADRRRKVQVHLRTIGADALDESSPW